MNPVPALGLRSAGRMAGYGGPSLVSTPGRFGWTGGTGTSVYTDPAEELIGILLTQREMISPLPPSVFGDFWTCVYQAISD